MDEGQHPDAFASVSGTARRLVYDYRRNGDFAGLHGVLGEHGFQRHATDRDVSEWCSPEGSIVSVWEALENVARTTYERSGRWPDLLSTAE